MDTSDPDPAVAELVEMVVELDADNERLRMKTLDLMRHMEEAVTARVNAEREADRLRTRVTTLERDLDSINRSFVVRTTAPLRRLVVWARRTARRS